MERLAVVFALAVAAAACNPKSLRTNYCYADTDCPQPPHLCDKARKMCILADASMDMSDTRDAGDGGDATDDNRRRAGGGQARADQDTRQVRPAVPFGAGRVQVCAGRA